MVTYEGLFTFCLVLRAVYIQLADREYYYPLRVVTAQEIAKTA